jgi:membrane glycosyltransferase
MNDNGKPIFPAAAPAGRSSELDPAASGGRRPLETSLRRRSYPSSMPEIRRISMAPSPIDRRPLHRLWRKIRRPEKKSPCASAYGAAAANPVEHSGWRAAARRRRIGMAALILLQTAAASWSLGKIFPYPWLNGLESAILVIFAILFSWISFGFWTAVAGFCIRWRAAERFAVADPPRDDDNREPLKSRTAALIPICNEDVERVFAGVEAICRSLAAAGRLGDFDFYVLSDTGAAETQVQEEIAWAKMCHAVQGFGRIFYRHRRNNIKRKSGNIADFLRRWGRNYDFMIVLDADSVMAGETLVRLVRMMERRPQAGIIQTMPTTVNRESLFARVQQFSSRVYGPMLAAGLHFWQLGESCYWGHNAIIRVAPFMKHCGLARLPGNAPLGGEILSHDFVEAALIGRAGWEVWLARDLGGSYEETPPTLLDELKRDRRWCQGNLQHLRLLLGDGFRAGHRALFSMGVMAYASAFFWAVFLLLGTVQIAVEALFLPDYFPAGPNLFPLWPQWRPEWAIALLSTTAVLLFLPKFLGLLLILKQRESRLFGGVVPLSASIVLEILLSTLLAPIRMWFHAKFVLVTLMGRRIKWGAQRRDDNETGWSEAIRNHGVSMLLALAWIAAAIHLDPWFAWWLLPVAGALVLSAPLSVYSSRVSFGRALRRCRLFMIPEELAPPEIIERLHAALQRRGADRQERDGFISAAIDPHILAVHVGLLRGRTPRSPAAAARNRDLREKALNDGPASLTHSERALLLQDVENLVALHTGLAQIDDPGRAGRWGLAGPA